MLTQPNENGEVFLVIYTEVEVDDEEDMGVEGAVSAEDSVESPAYGAYAGGGEAAADAGAGAGAGAGAVTEAGAQAKAEVQAEPEAPAADDIQAQIRERIRARAREQMQAHSEARTQPRVEMPEPMQEQEPQAHEPQQRQEPPQEQEPPRLREQVQQLEELAGSDAYIGSGDAEDEPDENIYAYDDVKYAVEESANLEDVVEPVEKPESESKPEPQPEPEAKLELEQEAKPELEQEAKPEPNLKATPKLEPASKSKAEPEPKSKAVAEPEQESDVKDDSAALAAAKAIAAIKGRNVVKDITGISVDDTEAAADTAADPLLDAKEDGDEAEVAPKSRKRGKRAKRKAAAVAAAIAEAVAAAEADAENENESVVGAVRKSDDPVEPVAVRRSAFDDDAIASAKAVAEAAVKNAAKAKNEAAAKTTSKTKAESKAAVASADAAGADRRPRVKSKRRKRQAVAAAVLVILVTAVVLFAINILRGGDDDGHMDPFQVYMFQEAGRSAAQAERIVIGAGMMRGFFKPHNASFAADRIISEAIYESLVIMGRDGLPEYRLAEDIAISEDGVLYVVTLREGIRFHDGKELTPEDVVASFKAVAAARTRLEPFLTRIEGFRDYGNGVADEIEGIAILNARMLTFTFRDPQPDDIWALSLGIQDEHNAEFHGIETVNGTGPYRYGRYESRTRQVTLLANHFYWDGMPTEERIYVRDIPDTDMVEALRDGLIDTFAFSWDSSVLEGLADIDGINVFGYPGLEISYLGFNFHSEVLTPEMRQAFSYAIDRDAVAKALYGGPVRGAYMPVPRMAYIAGDPDLIYRHDVNQARRLFSEAGYGRDPDGRLVKDGRQLTIRIAAADDDIRRRELDEIARQLTALGIIVQAETFENSEFIERLADREFDCFIRSYRAGRYISTGNLLVGSTIYFAEDWRNDAVLAAMEQRERALTFEEVQHLYTEIHRHYYDDVPGIPLAAEPLFVAARKGINGFSLSPFTSPFGRPEQLLLSNH